MYPKWLVFVLTLLGCLFLMASAAPVAGGDNAPVKRLKQFQARRPDGDEPFGRRATPVDNAKRNKPSNVKRNKPSNVKRSKPSNVKRSKPSNKPRDGGS